MVDIITFAVSIVGICAVITYWAIQADEPEKLDNKEFLTAIEASLQKKENINIILKDYEAINGEIGRRENINLLVGSILLTASALLLGNTALSTISKFPFAITSIFLFVIWLFALHNTTKKLNAKSYTRVRSIEQALTKHCGYEFGIHTYIMNKTSNKCGETYPWLRFRRGFWGYILLLISLAWLLLSLI
jgi:hypothetical protein